MMTNVEKVNEFLTQAKTFYFLTTDGDQPKGRPFGFKLLIDGVLYFGCGTFKNVFKQQEIDLSQKFDNELAILICL